MMTSPKDLGLGEMPNQHDISAPQPLPDIQKLLLHFDTPVELPKLGAVARDEALKVLSDAWGGIPLTSFLNPKDSEKPIANRVWDDYEIFVLLNQGPDSAAARYQETLLQAQKTLLKESGVSGQRIQTAQLNELAAKIAETMRPLEETLMAEQAQTGHEIHVRISLDNHRFVCQLMTQE